MRALLPLCLLALLAACSVQPVAEAPARPQRQQIGRFDIEGRISVRRDERPYHAHLAWHHEPERDEILLTGPLGQGLAQLTRDANGARLRTADRKELLASDWSSLAERVFGVPLPLAGISRWLAGDIAATARDAQGRPLRGTDEGWQISYPAYESARPDALPSTLELQRDDIEVRLLIDTWQLN